MPRLGQFLGSKHSRRKSYVSIATGVAAVGLAMPIGLASASVASAGSSARVSAVATSKARVLASDTFLRHVSASLGSADTGGTWRISDQKPTTLSVNYGAAIVRSVPAGSSVTAWLPSAIARDEDNVVAFALQTPSSSASGLYLSATARDQADGRRYYAKLTFSGGAPRVSISRTDGHGVETALGYAPVKWSNVIPTGHVIQVEISVTGASPTVVSVRAWPEGTTKPAWQLTVRDKSTSQIKIAGGVGYRAYRGWSSSVSSFAVTSLRASTTDAATAGSAGAVAPSPTKTPSAVTPTRTPVAVIPTPTPVAAIPTPTPVAVIPTPTPVAVMSAPTPVRLIPSPTTSSPHSVGDTKFAGSSAPASSSPTPSAPASSSPTPSSTPDLVDAWGQQHGRSGRHEPHGGERRFDDHHGWGDL